MEAIIPKFSYHLILFKLYSILLLLRTKRIISLHPKYVKILKFRQKLLIPRFSPGWIPRGSEWSSGTAD